MSILDTQLEKGSSQMSQAFKSAMRSWKSGVCLVTATPPGQEPIGIVCNSFTSVSMDPELILWCVDHGSTAIEAWRAVDAYALHILPGMEHPLSVRFVQRGGNKFAGLKYEINQNGSPIFPELATRFDCVLDRRITVGDHDLMIGQPTSIIYPANESESSCSVASSIKIHSN